MFPDYYKKEIVKLIHLLTDDPDYYYSTSLNVEKFDKLLKKMISLLEEVKDNGKND